MEQLSEKVFFGGAVVEILAYAALLGFCVRRRAGAWALLGALGGALSLLVAGSYLVAVLAAEGSGDYSLLQALVGPWGDIGRAVLGGAGTVLLVVAVAVGRRRSG